MWVSEQTRSWPGPPNRATPMLTTCWCGVTSVPPWPSPGQYASQLEDAEDIVQEAFHRAVRGLPDYDDRRPFNTWFYTILRNVARSTISKQSRRATLAPVTLLEDDHPAPTAIDPILVGDIEQAIQTLAQMQQMCIRLCDIEGLTSVEAARMLDVDAGTVRTHLHRARQKLRAVMDLQKRMTP